MTEKSTKHQGDDMPVVLHTRSGDALPVTRSAQLSEDVFIIQVKSGISAGHERKKHVTTAIPVAEIRHLLSAFSEISEASTALGRSDTGVLANLNAEALEERQRQLAKGELLTSGQLCEALRFSRQALSKAVRDWRMFFVNGPANTQLYPAFFSNPDIRSDLETISKELRDLDGARKWQFFTTPKQSLSGKTPLQAIAGGERNAVLRAADGFREREIGH